MKRIIFSLMIIGVAGAVAYSGTSAFFSDQEQSTGNVFTAGSIDLKVDHTYQAYNDEECEGDCIPVGDNLVINGGFEQPVVTDNKNWQLFNSAQVNGWTIEWESTETEYQTFTRPDDAFLELHRGVSGWLPEAGEQHAELDTDWGVANNEPAQVRIYQDIPTTPGTEYELTFYFSPRPNTNAQDNVLDPRWNGSSLGTVTAAGGSNTNWTEYTFTVQATGTSTRVEFADVSPTGANSLGVFLDSVSVYEIECGHTIIGGECTLWEEKDLIDGDYFFNFSDIKPGDFGINVISMHVYDNDAYACLYAENIEDNDNGLTDPESDVDTTGGDGEGELSQVLNIFAWHDLDGDGAYEPGDGEAGLHEPGLFLDVLGTSTVPFADSTNGNILTATTTDYLGLSWCAGTITVDDQTGLIECDPDGAGNETQSDSLTADVVLHAVQTRNNDSFECASLLGGQPADDGPIVVDADNTDWWFFEEVASGSGSYVNGPDTPPLGSGSSELTVDDTGRELFGTFLHAGQRLDELTSLTYNTYRSAGSAALAASLQLDIDTDVTDGDTSWQGRLVYEPYYTYTVLDDTWQTWDTQDDAVGGNWWFSGAPGNAVCPIGNPCTWSEVLSNFPDIGIRSAGPLTGALQFKVGGPWTGGFTGNVDAFSVGILGTETVYDFEL